MPGLSRGVGYFKSLFLDITDSAGIYSVLGRSQERDGKGDKTLKAKRGREVTVHYIIPSTSQ